MSSAVGRRLEAGQGGGGGRRLGEDAQESYLSVSCVQTSWKKYPHAIICRSSQSGEMENVRFWP